MLLLTDGRVMVQENLVSGCGNVWMILTPDASGSYLNGTWSTTGTMTDYRLYPGSTVLKDGRVFVVGGEYNGGTCAKNRINTSEIYDPVTNTWTATATFPQSQFGDDPTELLPNGNVLAGYLAGPQTYIYDVVNNLWNATDTKLRSDRSDEESWAKLPNGNVLSYDLWASIGNGTGSAQMYNPNTATWVDAGTVPGPLLSSAALGYELGPMLRLQDGRMFVIGANQYTALYTPSTNTWVAGPDTLGPATGTCTTAPCAYGADDAPAAELPNGHILYAADAGPTSGTFKPPTYLFEFNPTTNTTVQMAVQPPALTANNTLPAFITRFLMLPTGQALFYDGTSNAFDIYTPSSTLAAPPYRPIVQGIVRQSAGVYTLTGLQLNGQSAGAAYGDDVVTDENYPIVRLVNPTNGNTYYCKTTNWSNTAVGNTGAETITFTVAATVPSGNYSLIVSGAGIQGVPVGFSY